MAAAELDFDRGATIVRIDWVRLTARRPRAAGKNARLPEHGIDVSVPVARLTAGGVSGYGFSVVSEEHGKSLIGKTVGELFAQTLPIVRREFRPIEIPLLDWLGRATKRPVYQIVNPEVKAPFAVPCYDTSLYFDDLHLPDHDAAGALMAKEAAEGVAKGHRAFKVKIGRGAMHMPLMDGMARDIAVVNAIRKEIGPEAKLLVDANNGYNLNLTKMFLEGTESSKLHFIEEPFHEDGELYRHLSEWMAKREMRTLIADGEGDYSQRLLDWAKRGWVDVLQYDIFIPGFSFWLELVPQLHAQGIGAAPHHYGTMLGNYVAPHLAAGVPTWQFAEYDEAKADGIDTSGYRIDAGRIVVPEKPGFGLEFDERFFLDRVQASGWATSAN
ncbi:MAG TPA: enolase C-terminal domain-like protein [Tepidisphaeraceae bacterium]|nr:enolase C-terminal domain-like protein [Tepidisphaeraceae bacterium]